MKLENLIKDVKAEKPTSLPAELLTRKVNEAEAMVQDFLEVPQADRITYNWPDDSNKELVADDPYSRLYVSYLKAAIDFANEELESYSNNMSQYELDYSEWVNYTQRHGGVPETMPRKIRWW